MTLFYLIGLMIVIGIVIYLFIALLKPELFT
jgi:K+-transporting ATPase KdpF subunit